MMRLVNKTSIYADTDRAQFVGRDSIDWVVFGIVGLLQWCIQLTKSLKKPMVVQYES